jgi:hypothetical protein
MEMAKVVVVVMEIVVHVEQTLIEVRMVGLVINVKNGTVKNVNKILSVRNVD